MLVTGPSCPSNLATFVCGQANRANRQAGREGGKDKREGEPVVRRGRQLLRCARDAHISSTAPH